MKKKVAMMLAAVMLSLSVSVTAYAGPWGKIRQIIDILLGDGGVPCWSAGDCPEGCTSFFVLCSSCVQVKGSPTGGQGNC